MRPGALALKLKKTASASIPCVMTTSARTAPLPISSPHRERPRIGYLTSMYPAVSHTFIQREILALRERGWRVDTFSIRRAPAEQLLSERDRREAASSFSVLPAGPGAVLAAQAAMLREGPRAHLATFRRAAATPVAPGRDTGGRMRQAFYLLEATILRRELNLRGIRHLHVHFANPAADVAMLACRLPGPPLTWSFTMHGSTEFWDAGRHRLTAKIADARFVACVSHFARSQMMAQAAAESDWQKLHLVHCGVDPDHFVAPLNPGRDRQLKVLFVGRMICAKGPTILLRSVAELRAANQDVQVTFIGDGPDMSAIATEARGLGLEGATRFLGAVGQDEIRAHYEAADAFCLPSFAEGLPVVLMEAMAMRRPVIATRIAGVPELIDDGESGLLVAPGTVPALTAALTRLLDDIPLRHRLAEAGRHRILEDFDVRANAARLADIFDDELATVGG